MMFVSGVLIREIDEYSVFVLPEPVGPGDEHHAPRLLDRRLELGERLGLEAELRHVEHQLVLVEETHDDLLAEERRQARHAEVDVLRHAVVLEADLDAAVLRQALLRDVELRHDLDARRDRVAELHRRLHDVVEQAVDAVADAQLLLVRLDVDVAGALLDRRHQDDVHQLDDRRLLALLGEHLGADLLELLEDLDVAGVAEDRHVLERLAGDLEGARRRRGAAAGGLAVVPRDRLDDRGLGRDDRLDVVARHELDVVHGEHVGRVGHRDRQRGAGARERDDLVLLRGLGGNELDDAGSISNWASAIEGTPYCLLRSAVISSSLTKPSLTRLKPSFPPFWR